LAEGRAHGGDEGVHDGRERGFRDNAETDATDRDPQLTAREEYLQPLGHLPRSRQPTRPCVDELVLRELPDARERELRGNKKAASEEERHAGDESAVCREVDHLSAIRSVPVYDVASPSTA
jgi:hypothetical protein